MRQKVKIGNYISIDGVTVKVTQELIDNNPQAFKNDQCLHLQELDGTLFINYGNDVIAYITETGEFTIRNHEAYDDWLMSGHNIDNSVVKWCGAKCQIDSNGTLRIPANQELAGQIYNFYSSTPIYNDCGLVKSYHNKRTKVYAHNTTFL